MDVRSRGSGKYPYDGMRSVGDREPSLHVCMSNYPHPRECPSVGRDVILNNARVGPAGCSEIAQSILQHIFQSSLLECDADAARPPDDLRFSAGPVIEVAPAPSGAASAVGAGNFVARVKASVGVAFQGEWSFRARSTAFQWMLRVGSGGNCAKCPPSTHLNPEP